MTRPYSGRDELDCGASAAFGDITIRNAATHRIATPAVIAAKMTGRFPIPSIMVRSRMTATTTPMPTPMNASQPIARRLVRLTHVDSSSRRQKVAWVPTIVRPVIAAFRVLGQATAAMHHRGQPRYFVVVLRLFRKQSIDLYQFFVSDRGPTAATNRPRHRTNQ